MNRHATVVGLAVAAAFAGMGSAAAEPTPPPASDAPALTREARVFRTVAVRAAADPAGAVVRVIPADSLVVLHRDPAPTGWVHVVVDGRPGYVPASHAEAPWLGDRAAGDTSVRPVPAEVQQTITDHNL